MTWIRVCSLVGEVAGPVADGMLYEHSHHFALTAVTVGVVIFVIVLQFIMTGVEREAKSLSEDISAETTLLILQPAIYQPEIS